MVVKIYEVPKVPAFELAQFLLETRTSYISDDSSNFGLYDFSIDLTGSKISIDVDGSGIKFYHYDKDKCYCKICDVLDPNHFSIIKIL